MTDDEGSRYFVAIFSRAEVEAWAGESLDTLHAEDVASLAEDLTGWGETYGGPGRWFRHAATMRVYKRNVRVRSFAGLDI